jgi:hypothetical protein
VGNLYREFKGLANVLPPERMGFSYLSAALNVDIDDTGMIRRRPGYRKIYDGSPHSLWSDGRVCLFSEGGQMKEFLRPEGQGGPYGARTLCQGLTSGRRLAYLSLNGTVYYSDGAVTGAIDTRGEGGCVPRTWGMTPPAAPELSPADGGLRPGRYAVALTYVRRGGAYSPSGGQESGTSALSYIEITSGGINASVTASDDPDVTGINLYMTTTSGQTLYLARRITTNQSASVSLRDEPAPMLTAVTEGLRPPPAGHLITHYRGRIYTAAYDVLYYSEPFAYELFNMAGNWIPFNGMITLLAAAEDGIFIGTTDELFMLRGAAPDKFTLHRVSDCGALYATQTTGELRRSGANSLQRTLFWESRRGKCSVSLAGGTEITYAALGVYSYECGLTGSGLLQSRDGMNLYISVTKGTNTGGPPVNRYMEDTYAGGAPTLPLISISAS